MNSVHVVVPDGIDDPGRPSGGNRYDRRVCAGLSSMGWELTEHGVAGPWPRPDAVASHALAAVVARIPDGAVVLVDGLIASASPAVLIPAADRLHLVVLVHLPLSEDLSYGAAPAVRAGEAAVLGAAHKVIVTSSWTRDRLLCTYDLPPATVVVAAPGVDGAPLARVTAAGATLLCVAAVTPIKGHDLLLDALATVADLGWRLVCVGSVEADPTFVTEVARRAELAGIGERVCFRGPLTRTELDEAYVAADVVVLASRVETYGMVVTEAMARGLPVIAPAVGGLPEALGRTPTGCRPGLLVAAGERAELAGAIRSWLSDDDLRRRLRLAVQARRETLAGWADTTDRISGLLRGVAG